MGRPRQKPLHRVMLVSEFRKRRFAGKSKPCERTIKRWIKERTIPGKKIGGRYYGRRHGGSQADHWRPE